MRNFTFTLFFLLGALNAQAQVVINEISAANIFGPLDNFNEREDWIELRNTGSLSVNLSGWFLSDNPANPQKWVIPNGVNIAAGAHRIVYCSGRGVLSGGALHSNFKLTQTDGESVVLTQPNGVTADTYTFNIPNQTDHSYARAPGPALEWKVCTNPTPGAVNTTGFYDAYAPKVQASLEAGFYPGSISVSLSVIGGHTIRYTTNGSEPTPMSPVYSTPISITSTTVLKARAYAASAQILPGFVLANTYFINVNHSIPVLSIAGDNIVSLLNGAQSRPFGSFEYFENNVLEDEAYGEFNKHGNDSWAYNQRGIDWITRDQMGYKDEVKHKFFQERTRKKFQRLILKAAANDNYPAAGGAHIRDSYIHTLALRGGLNLDARTHLSIILYVNGQYWGVYDLREKADDSDYTDYYYDQDEFDLDFIKTWGGTWNEYGTMTDWTALKGYILGNNMAIPANYDYVQQRFDLLSLVDYIIINQHTVCKDWLNWNTAWWRGRNPNGEAQRWRYTLWDMDATFGHYINYTGIPDPGPTADPCDVEDIPNNGDPQNHIDILTALFANPDFKSLYINRYAELLNGPLSCQSMIALLDEMTNIIAPEMPGQCARWGGTVAGWNQNVQKIRDFINARCQMLEPSIVDCYNVTGPYNLTVKIFPPASPNQVEVNNITPAVYPYSGDFFGDVNIPLAAKAATGWQFDHWEVMGNTFSPDQLSAAISLAFKASGMVTAFFVPTAPCTSPENLSVADSLVSPVLNWTGPLSATSYLVRFRELGAPQWTTLSLNQNSWKFDTLPGCTHFEMQVQSVCPQGSSAFTDFDFGTPNKVLGFSLTDATICNNDTLTLDATFAGVSYLWDDNTTGATRKVSQTGDYWVTVKSGACLLTDTAHVVKINATAQIEPSLCPGKVFTLAGINFDEQNPQGQVILKQAASNSCDSIINVTLKLLSSSKEVFNINSCDPAQAGVDTVFLINAVGCDSLIVTTTTLVPKSLTQRSVLSCNPALVGTDTLILSNFLGCDSLVITTTSFDVTAIPVTQLQARNCDPALVGVDTVILNSLAGCDSLVITTTTLAPKSQIQLSAQSCNPALIGTDTLILSNFLGCDSLVITTTSFDVTAIPVTQLQARNCDPALLGVDTVILNSLAGCDSLVITTTTLAPKSQIQLSAQSCNPALIGIDTLILSNFLGCDSLVITTTSFDVTAIPVTQLQAWNCDPALVGIDTVILNSGAGCDSLVITTTALALKSESYRSETTCDWAQAGTDTLRLSNFYGCDSLVITATTYTGLDFLISTKEGDCFNSKNGEIRLDTAFTDALPVSLLLNNAAPRQYEGQPLTWSDLGAGSYTITATNASGCSLSQEFKIEEKDALLLDLSPQTRSLHLGDSLWVEPVANFQPALANWSPPLGVRCTECPATFFSPLESTRYTLFASDDNGCTASATLEIQVAQDIRIFVPNAIRPGGDGQNANLFVWAGPEVVAIQNFQIYDRWGNVIFEEKGPSLPETGVIWDGTFRGKTVQSGVYVWMCKIQTVDGRILNKSGDISVIR